MNLSNVDALIYSLRNFPEDWKVDKYTLSHSSGIEIWIANGWIFLEQHNVSSTAIDFGFLIGRLRFWHAFKKWNRRRLMQVLDLESAKKE